MQRLFLTQDGRPVSGVTTTEARELLVAVERSSQLGIAELIENGARTAFDLVTSEIGGERGTSVAVLAGSGFTGAVAFALARHLANHGYSPNVVHLFGSERRENARQRETLILSGATVSERLDDLDSNAALLVDALVAREGAPTDRVVVQAALEKVAGLRESGTQILSLEMPTGVDPVTGVPMDGAVPADVTF